MSYIYRIQYRKDSPLKFISHLDLNALFSRTLRRTQMDVELTQGYNPRFKVSFGPALSLGITGWQEYLDLYLKEELQAEQVKDKINQVAPNGLTITGAEKIHEQNDSLSQSIRWAVYLVLLRLDKSKNKWKTGEWENWIRLQMNTFLDQKDIIVEKQTKKGLRKVDFRPCIQKMEFVSWQDGDFFVRLIVDIQYMGSMNPQIIINTFLGESENREICVKEIIREKLVLDTNEKDLK